jgi:hypothetical protein
MLSWTLYFKVSVVEQEPQRACVTASFAARVRAPCQQHPRNDVDRLAVRSFAHCWRCLSM